MADGKRDIGGMVVAAIFIVVGIVSIWDTTRMVDSDSYVFPRTVALFMISFSAIFIVWNFMKPPATDAVGRAPGSTIRRVGLVVSMLGCAFIMPFTGFFIAGISVFALIMMFAMYEQWTRSRLILYPVICVIVVSGFYLLFAKALLVPLPETPFL
jgi:putative tricarboxylic transport membrane protein